MSELRSLARRARGALRSGRARLGAGRRRSDAAALVRAGLVQRDWIALQSGRSWDDDTEAADWLLLHGVAAGVSPHRLVEPAWADAHDPRAALARLADRLDGARVHPLVDPLGAPAVLPGLHDGTALAAPGTTYAHWRTTVDREQAALLAQEALAGRRTSPAWDAAADAAYVARTSGLPLPEGDGPLVSVVMPVRNRPEHVRRAIESVRAQALERWQLVVVDDGSTDTTPDVVADAAAEDPRIVLLHRAPEGVCAARNAGIAAATAPYVAFLDSDNTWLPHYLQVMVAAMTEQGLDAAYAVVDEIGDSGHRYRTFQVTEEALHVGNAVDLNVLVVSTALLREVGCFDPSLRRMVDYDLVWRLARVTTLQLLPFVGVAYAARSDVPHRISATESFSWDDVVKTRHLVDWPALDAGLDARRSDVVSVVVPSRTGGDHAVTTAEAALSAPGAEVVVVGSALPAPQWRLLWARLGLRDRVTLVRSPGALDRAALTDLGVARTSGSVVVVVPEGIRVGPEGLQALVAPVLSGEAVAAVPDGADGVVACDATALVAARGLDPLFTDDVEVADLVRRLQAQGGTVVRLDVPLTVDRAWPEPPPARAADNAREWARRWPDAAAPVPGAAR